MPSIDRSNDEPTTSAPASDKPAPCVPILGEHHILAEAILHILPHAVKAEKNEPARVIQHLVIEPDGTLCGTNGRTIAAHRWAVTPAPEVRVLIELPDADSNTMLRRLARKAIKEQPLFGVALAPSGQTMVLTVGRESLTITPAFHASEFPDWRRLFARYRDSESRKQPTPIIGLNTDYLKLFDAGCEFTLGGAHDAVIVRKISEPNFWGAVMPINIEAPQPPFPAWCASDDYTPAPERDVEDEG